MTEEKTEDTNKMTRNERMEQSKKERHKQRNKT